MGQQRSWHDLGKQKYLLAIVISLFLISFSVAQDEAERDEALDFAPGLFVEYATGTARVRQIASTASLSLDEVPRDLTVRWTGRLFVQYDNRYSIRPYGCGEVTIKINSTEILSNRNAKTEWYEPVAIDLEYGWHPVEITYRPNGEHSQFRLFWSSELFLTEPITSWFHRASELKSDGGWEQGRRLLRELMCVNCHEVPGIEQTVDGPPLDKLSGFMNALWLARFLASDQHGKNGRAPSFSLDRNHANSISLALIDGVNNSDGDFAIHGDPEQGREVFHTVGCLACHVMDGIGTANEGGELTAVGDKRTPKFLAKWLDDPSQINSHHRMPKFDLTEGQVHDLVAYLSKGRTDRISITSTDDSPISIEELIHDQRCAACHKLPPNLQLPSNGRLRTKLTTSSDWSNGCVGKPAGGHPTFALPDGTKKAIRGYLVAAESLPGPLSDFLFSEADRRNLIRNFNCLGCHSRGTGTGLRDAIEQAAAKYPELAEHMSAMTPPSLNSVGDKLKNDTLRDAVRGKGGVRRPWKRVQMPRFNLSDAQVDNVVQTLIGDDRVPDMVSAEHRLQDLPDGRRLFVAGSRLVTSDGFGCTSCHKIGKTKPNKAPTHLLGPDLSKVGNRIREAWFRRWLKNPAKIVPRVEMPSVQHPVRGLLDDDLAHQIAATWHVLNMDRFDPPLPDAVRVVGQFGDSESRAHVLTDVMRYDGHALVKPFAIGLANRHNILLDLEHGRMLDWSIGDTAKQRTQGKTWFWQWAGQSLMGNERSDVSMVHLIVDGQRVAPSRRGQFVIEPHSWEHGSASVALKYQLSFQVPRGPIHIWVHETYAPIAGQSGFRRTLDFSRLPSGSSIEVALLDETRQFRSIENGLQWKTAQGTQVSASISTSGARIEEGSAIVRAQERDLLATIEIQYAARVAPQPYPFAAEIPKENSVPQAISVAPGFEAERLLANHEIMPTAFAWNRGGEMFVTSLKGRVWRFQESSSRQSGLVGHPIGDELAAPFGIVARDGYLDVVNKGGLLRLFDADGDGTIDKTQTIASGWGHTDDYHDWAIGLPADDHGNYFISIACQQDDRSPAAARLRGKVVKLIPRSPTESDPHLYELAEVSGGHRFAIGIARSSRGDLFVSDNQGNFNPYNELNHVRPGHRYGFINRLEKKTLANPPLTIPSIKIPHPWTRSVNGICFLETPNNAERELSQRTPKNFGPFEGHLVGCEYDTRRLVRMSLQRIGSTYQGAIYPFSRVLPGKENALLGPVACAVSPRGELFIGEMRDSGWGAGNNIGQVVRMRFSVSTLPCGIAEVRAVARGFEIEFTKPIDLQKAVDVANYEISSATRISTPAYGGDDRNRRRESIQRVTVVDSAPHKGPIVRIDVDDLRSGYVYDFHLKSIAPDDGEFFPAEAYYSLNHRVE